MQGGVKTGGESIQSFIQVQEPLLGAGGQEHHLLLCQQPLCLGLPGRRYSVMLAEVQKTLPTLSCTAEVGTV